MKISFRKLSDVKNLLKEYNEDNWATSYLYLGTKKNQWWLEHPDMDITELNRIHRGGGTKAWYFAQINGTEPIPENNQKIMAFVERIVTAAGNAGYKASVAPINEMSASGERRYEFTLKRRKDIPLPD